MSSGYSSGHPSLCGCRFPNLGFLTGPTVWAPDLETTEAPARARHQTTEKSEVAIRAKRLPQAAAELEQANAQRCCAKRPLLFNTSQARLPWVDGRKKGAS